MSASIVEQLYTKTGIDLTKPVPQFLGVLGGLALMISTVVALSPSAPPPPQKSNWVNPDSMPAKDVYSYPLVKGMVMGDAPLTSESGYLIVYSEKSFQSERRNPCGAEQYVYNPATGDMTPYYDLVDPTVSPKSKIARESRIGTSEDPLRQAHANALFDAKIVGVVPKGARNVMIYKNDMPAGCG